MMPNVLLIGTLPKLLQQRKKAFEASGYRVCTARDIDDALALIDAQGCDLVVIGIGVQEDERTQLTATLKTQRPNVKIICLYLGSIHNVEAADAVLQVTCGEQDLVRAAQFLTSL